MRKDIRRRHDAHVRTNGVCTEHSEVFDTATGAHKMRASLGTCVAKVYHLLAVQKRSIEERRAAAEQCRQARRLIRNAGKAVVKVGILVKLDDTLMGTMRLPLSVSDDDLVAYMQGLLDRVSPYTDAFVDEGLPADLLTTLASG